MLGPTSQIAETPHRMLGPPSQIAERPELSALFNFIGNQVLILFLLVSQVRQHLKY